MTANDSADAIFELMEHQRAIRLFGTEPIDDTVIERVLDAATRAPSARNIQPWRFIVVRDSESKRELGTIFDELGVELLGYDPDPDDRTAWADVPVLIVVASEGLADASSIYPAVQNLLLALQAVGLGSVLTTRWKRREDEVRAILQTPDEMALWAIMPVGVPLKPPGRNRRRPVAEVTFRDRAGSAW